MVLDDDRTIRKQSYSNLFRPLSTNDYIHDLRNMTHDEWMKGVSFNIFRELFLDLIRVEQEYPGTGPRTSAIEFGDGILNFRFTVDDDRYMSGIFTIALDIILCNCGLRDSNRCSYLVEKQLRVLRATSNQEVVNGWSLKTDKEEIVKYMYKFMKSCRGKMIYQEISSKY